jgi:hypothetical protein
VQDRWAGTCKTNWPRAHIYSLFDLNDNYDVYVVRESGSGESHLSVDGGTVDCYDYCWGNMVYAPNQLTEACIRYNNGYCAAQPNFVNR